MVAWIPSRWVDEHETVLSRENLCQSRFHPSAYMATILLYPRETEWKRETERMLLRKLFELQNLINTTIIK